MQVVGHSGVGKTRDQFFALFGEAVAVGILQTPEAGGRGAVHGAVVPRNALRKHQLVGIYGALVEAAIAVRVFEQADLVRRIAGQLGAAQVHAGRIANVEPPTIVKGRQHRTLDQRRPGHQLDRKTRGHAQRCQTTLFRIGRPGFLAADH